MKSWVQSGRPRTNSRLFPFHLSAPAAKKRCRVIRGAAPVTQTHLSKPDRSDACNATATRNASLYPLQMSHACHCFQTATKPTRFAQFWQGAQSLAPAMQNKLLNVQKCSVPFLTSVPVSFLHFWLRKVLRATTACTFSICELPKVLRAWWSLCIFTSKCASRHNGVHFFDMWSSKSVPSMVCFVHFDFEMCFAPQRCALFRHLNFPKCFEVGVFGAILTSNCASRHNGVQFVHLSSDQMAPHPPL